MAATIQLEIVTPEGVQLETSVEELTAPSVKGEFGVLPEHRPLLAALRTGIVTYRMGGDVTSVAIGPGFARVVDDKAVIITEKFIKKADVDPIVVRKDLKEADDALNKLAQEPQSEEERNDTLKLIADLRWAAVRLELYGDPPPPTVVVAHEMRLMSHEDYSQTLATTDREDAHVEHVGSMKED
jgi:F-type H+-transporting ATPase subunit epsilon